MYPPEATALPCGQTRELASKRALTTQNQTRFGKGKNVPFFSHRTQHKKRTHHTIVTLHLGRPARAPLASRRETTHISTSNGSNWGGAATRVPPRTPGGPRGGLGLCTQRLSKLEHRRQRSQGAEDKKALYCGESFCGGTISWIRRWHFCAFQALHDAAAFPSSITGSWEVHSTSHSMGCGGGGVRRLHVRARL
jgi:hypothetical protein